MALLFSALRVLLGLFFAVSGAVKLTDLIAGDAHRQLKTQFEKFADVFPLKEFGYKPEPGMYMEIVGWIELIGGFLLAFGPQLLQEISNFVLTVIMIVPQIPWHEIALRNREPSQIAAEQMLVGSWREIQS